MPLSPTALPASGLIPGGPALVEAAAIDLTLGVSRVQTIYNLRNPSEAEILQRLEFHFPALTLETLAQDPALADIRQLNFLLARIRVDGERRELSPRFELLDNGRPIDLKDKRINIRGASLGQQMQLIPQALEALGYIPESVGNLGLKIVFFWDERFAAGQSKQVSLSYRPYPGNFRLADLHHLSLPQESIDHWQEDISEAFCLSYAENADLASAMRELPSDAILQTFVLDFDARHTWAKPVEQVSFAVDPNLYDESMRRISRVSSYMAFCGRQGQSLNLQGQARVVKQYLDLVRPISLLFLHRNERSEDSSELRQALALSSLFRGESCEPANGLRLPCSDMRPLTEEELGALTLEELLQSELEILARRGAYFKNPDIRAFFEQLPWYEPFTWEPLISDLERNNMHILESLRLKRLANQRETASVNSAPESGFLGDSNDSFISSTSAGSARDVQVFALPVTDFPTNLNALPNTDW